MNKVKLPVLSIAIMALSLSAIGCDALSEKPAETLEIPNLNLVLTPIPGWTTDNTLTLEDPAKGGVLVRMSSTPDLPGAPKFQIYLDPLRVKSPPLDTLAKEQWARMKSIENQAGITVEKLEKTKVKLMDQDAVILDQTYTLGSGPAQIAVSERTWLMQHENRGLAFIISGRTELLSPWSDQVDDMVNSLSLKKISTK